MAWNGAGTFVRTNGDNTGSNLWQQDEAEGIPIRASRFDAHDQDIAGGINNCVALDGQNSATANLNLGGYRYTNAGVATAATDLIRTSQVQNSSVIWGGTAANTPDLPTITLTPALTAYAAGQQFAFIAASQNTGATKLNINSLGAKDIRNVDRALLGGEIVAGMIVHVIYDGTYFQLLNPLYRLFAETAITAAGTQQSDAAALTGMYNMITNASGTNGVRLPSAVTGNSITVVNGTDDDNDLLIYPATNEFISADPPVQNASISLPRKRIAVFYAADAIWWYTV